MRKEEVFEAIVQADAEDLVELASTYRTSIQHSVIREPSQELIMFRAEESVEKLDFNLGEVLVTTAEIKVGEAIGYSMVMDMENDKALDCALIMGVYEAGLPESNEIEKLVSNLQEKSHKRFQEEMKTIETTKVNFELMGGQDPNVKHNASEES